MPLGSYGVAAGTLSRFKRESPDAFGKYYHGFIYLNTPAGEYECAVDVATPSNVQVQFRIVQNLDPALFAAISGLSDGFHPLVSNASSGAIDYIRSPLFELGPVPAGASTAVQLAQAAIQMVLNLWHNSTGDNALDELETLLAGCQRVFVFGEPYSHGLGSHNVHMNQGDPPGIHQPDDGIWQDGGSIIQNKDGEYLAFLTKFSTQSLTTGNNGLPLAG